MDDDTGGAGGIPDGADLLARGVARLLREMGQTSLTEFTLRSGRRADLAAIDRGGKITIVEIKRSLADFRADAKWPEYLEFCDAFFFAVPVEFPRDVLPEDTGLLIADRYGAELIRPALLTGGLHASRRKEILLRFATTAANRLQRLTDPELSA